MHPLTIVQFVAMAIAAITSATRLLKSTEPFWTLNAKLAQWMPPLLVALPAAANGLLGTHDWIGVIEACCGAVALALPGLHSHSVGAPPATPTARKVLGVAGAVMSFAVAFAATAALVASCLLVGCGLGAAFWPAAVQCLPASAQAVADVEQVLKSGGSAAQVEQALEALAVKYTKSVVLCIVSDFVDQWETPSAQLDPQSAAALQTAKQFLANSGSKVQK
jgi:hypothetical protein